MNGAADHQPEPVTGPGLVPPAAVYLHLPFCFHKCHYCDLYSVVDDPRPAAPVGPPPGPDSGSPPGPHPARPDRVDVAEPPPPLPPPAPRDRQPAFTRAIIAELDTAARRLRAAGTPPRPSTVFAGGGTPTFLRPNLWARLLDTLHAGGWLDDATEFTVEANPETVTEPLMQQLADGGVNRVSIGAQSFSPSSLAALERWHRPESVARAVTACRAAGIDNLSLDLIFAVPGQTLAMLDNDLDRLLELKPDHLSTYGLTYEPQTPLAARLRVGRVTPVGEDLERAMYERVLERLAAAGFAHYEVSNWARVDPAGRRDFRCRHNLTYWNNGDWLGFGPGAASHAAGVRWRNRPNLDAYTAWWGTDANTPPRPGTPGPPLEDVERLDADDRVGERFMLGLRLREGLDEAWIDAHVPPTHRRAAALEELTGLGLLESRGRRRRLTPRGLMVADSVIAKLL